MRARVFPEDGVLQRERKIRIGWLQGPSIEAIYLAEFCSFVYELVFFSVYGGY
jgi:hypothetical protein